MKIQMFLIVLLIFITSSFSQNASTREWTIFQKGVSEYQKGNYEKARQSFSLMLNKLPNSALTTANYLMLAKTNYKSGDYQVALQQCEEFKKAFPTSQYVDDIRYLMANSYYRQQRLEPAVTTWLKVGLGTSDNQLQNKALSLADEVLSYKLDRQAIEDLNRQYMGAPLGEAFRYHLAAIDQKQGHTEKARKGLKALISVGKSSFYVQKSKQLLDRMEGTRSDEIYIAALLPLSGNNESVGKELLKGFNLGVIEYNKSNTGKKIVVDEFDYGSSLIKAITHIKNLVETKKHVFVYGPVENDIVAACAAIADYEGMTIVSPTASSDIIKQIANNSINLAPTVKTMAASIQAYATDSLALKRMATFSPIDDYFITMTDAFSDGFKEQGGNLVTQEWYYPGDQNFKKQFRKMKRVGLRLAFKDSLAIETPEITDEAVDSLYTLYLEEQRTELKETKTKLDSADILVTTFDGMFIPVFEDDINFVASQFAFSNFKTRLLGNADWYNKDALKKNRSYVDGIVFVTDGYFDEENWDYRQFRNNYRNTFRETPEKFALISYDSFKFLAGVLKRTDVNRSNFLEKVVQLKPYQGIYRNIDIDQNRSNKSVRLLQYIYGQIVPIQ